MDLLVFRKSVVWNVRRLQRIQWCVLALRILDHRLLRLHKFSIRHVRSSELWIINLVLLLLLIIAWSIRVLVICHVHLFLKWLDTSFGLISNSKDLEFLIRIILLLKVLKLIIVFLSTFDFLRGFSINNLIKLCFITWFFLAWNHLDICILIKVHLSLLNVLSLSLFFSKAVKQESNSKN